MVSVPVGWPAAAAGTAVGSTDECESGLHTFARKRGARV